jgi:hypothetical protein
MPKVIDLETGEVTRLPYEEGGIAASTEADRKAAAIASAPKNPTQADVNEAFSIVHDKEALDIFDLESSKQTIKNATPEQKAIARENMNIPNGMNMGGVVVDELGYMNGGATYTKRGPIKYSKGGAVRGKTFSGSY